MVKLDLRAVEARHKETMNGFSSNPGAYVNSAADVPALLAHIHALRVLANRARFYMPRIDGVSEVDAVLAQATE